MREDMTQMVDEVLKMTKCSTCGLEQNDQQNHAQSQQMERLMSHVGDILAQINPVVGVMDNFMADMNKKIKTMTTTVKGQAEVTKPTCISEAGTSIEMKKEALSPFIGKSKKQCLKRT